MKILFVLEHFYPYIGGAEKLFYELSLKLAEKGYKIVVVTTQYDSKLPLHEFHENIEIVRVKCQNRFGFTFLSLPKVIKYAKGCQLIHTTTYNAALPAMIAGKLSRKPVLVTFHEVWSELWKKLPFISFFEKYAFYYFEKLLLNLPFHRFIAVSDFTKSKLISNGVSEDRIVRIYNGIDYSQIVSEEREENEMFTYTYFGRLGISKGLNILIPAAAEFKKLYPNSKLKLIIPKKPERMYREVQKLITVLELESYVEMHHDLSQEQLYSELCSSSCVVIPSYSEGFCFAAAETVALRVPIISSKKGALKEVVSGKFINLSSLDSKALVEALTLGVQNRWNEEPIRYFRLKKSVEQYEELYTSLL